MAPILTLAFTLLLSGAPADLPATAPDCASVLGGPAPVQLALGDIGSQSVCVADCNEFPDVSCQSADCAAQNRNCSLQKRGWVRCNGVYTYCGPACPPICEEGTYRIIRYGGCCDPPDLGEPGAFQQCQNGSWVTVNETCLPSSKCYALP